jgi:hypothetical protein
LDEAGWVMSFFYEEATGFVERRAVGGAGAIVS